MPLLCLFLQGWRGKRSRLHTIPPIQLLNDRQQPEQHLPPLQEQRQRAHNEVDGHRPLVEPPGPGPSLRRQHPQRVGALPGRGQARRGPHVLGPLAAHERGQPR